MTKQEKIQEAYGENWEYFKDYVDENGWIRDKDFWGRWPEGKIKWETTDHDNEFYDTRRPLSLSGIENNNGWTVLKGIKNEIQHDGDIWIFNKNGNIELWLENQFLPLNHATHWKPIIKPKPPIY